MPIAGTYSLVFSQDLVVHDDTFHRAVYSQGLSPVSGFTTSGSSAVIPIINDDGIAPYQPAFPIRQRAYQYGVSASLRRQWDAQGWFSQVALGPAVDDPYISPLRPAVSILKRAWWDEFLQQTAIAPAVDDLPSPSSWSGIVSARSRLAYAIYLTTEWRKRLDAQGWFSQAPISPAVDDLYRKTVFSMQSGVVSGFVTSGGANPIPIVVDDLPYPSQGMGAILQRAYTARLNLEWQKRVGAQEWMAGIPTVAVFDDPYLRVSRPAPSVLKVRWWDEFLQQVALAPAIDDPYLRLTRPSTALQKRVWWDEFLQQVGLAPAVDDPYTRIQRPTASVQKRAWWDEWLKEIALLAPLDDPPRKLAFITSLAPVSGYVTSGTGGLTALPLPLDDSGIRVTTFRLPYRLPRWIEETLSPTLATILVSDDALQRQVPLVRPSLPRHPYLIQEIFPVIAGPTTDDPARRGMSVSVLVAVSGFATSGASGPAPLPMVLDDSVFRASTFPSIYRVRRWINDLGVPIIPPPVPGSDDIMRRITYVPVKPLTVKQWAMFEGFPGELIPPDDPFTFLLSSVVAQQMPWESAPEAVTLLVIVPQLIESAVPIRRPMKADVYWPQRRWDDPIPTWLQGVNDALLQPQTKPAAYRTMRRPDEPIMVAPIVPLIPVESMLRMPSPLWVPPTRRIWVPDDFLIVPQIVPSLIGELCVEIADSAAHCELFTSAARAELGTSSAGLELQTNLCRAGFRPQF